MTMSDTIFTSTTYFKLIVSWLNLVENVRLRLLSTSHDDFYKSNDQISLFKELIKRDYGTKFNVIELTQIIQNSAVNFKKLENLYCTQSIHVFIAEKLDLVFCFFFWIMSA